jgi:hypothetical protein
MTPHNRAMLASVCEAAGVTFGAYDRLILDWLATWSPATCAAVADWITRAADGEVAAQ